MKKIALLLAIIFVVSGCTIFEEPTPVSSPQNNAGATTTKKTTSTETTIKEITITSKDMSFEPNILDLKAGQPVKLTFLNTGTHTFTVDAFGVNAGLAGTSTTVEFTPPKAGSFDFYCAIAGHKEAGMKGTLNVSE